MKMGRPTKYRPELCEKVDEYLATATKENMHLPKLESFALFIGVNKDTLQEWRTKYPDFSVALRKIMTVQAERLIDDGIYGGKEVNPTIIKLLLENNHDMRTKTQTEFSGNGIKLNLITDGTYIPPVGAASSPPKRSDPQSGEVQGAGMAPES